MEPVHTNIRKNDKTNSCIFFALIDLWHFYFMPVNSEKIPKSSLSLFMCTS